MFTIPSNEYLLKCVRCCALSIYIQFKETEFSFIHVCMFEVRLQIELEHQAQKSTLTTTLIATGSLGTELFNAVFQNSQFEGEKHRELPSARQFPKCTELWLTTQS